MGTSDQPPPHDAEPPTTGRAMPPPEVTEMALPGAEMALPGAEVVFDTDANAATTPGKAHSSPYEANRVFVSLRPPANTANRAAWQAEWRAKQHAARERVGPALRDNLPVDLRQRSLRLALAMRGGVSLAVWIGGAVAELDFVRALRVYSGQHGIAVAMAWDRETPPPPGVQERAYRYAELLAANGYHRIELDVFAGASAGGLNSVLAAVAQRAGRSVEGALETWEQAGGLHRLLHHEGWKSIESVLRGDDYFYERVLDRLVTFYEHSADASERMNQLQPHPGLETEAVSIHLSATVANAQESESPEIREGHAGFRFAAGVTGADIPNHDVEAGERAASLRRLALAARTTSSFPGAFEPATVWSLGREEVDDNDPAQSGKPALDNLTPKTLDLSAAFLAHRPDKRRGPFRVIDGGVFDNIPIERAFRAIRLQSAANPVHRSLVYLDPSPPLAPELARPHSDRLNDLIAVLVKTFSAKRYESEREDKAEMQSFVQRHEERRGRYDVLATLRADGIDLADAELAYARSRSSADSILLAEVLAHPEQWQLEQNLTPRRSFTDSDDEAGRRDPQERALKWVNEMRLHDFVNELTADEASRVSRDPIAARETSLWLLECIQWIEIVMRVARDAPETDTELHRTLRLRLYEAVERCDELVRDRTLRVITMLREDEPGVEAREQGWWPESAEPELDSIWSDLGEALSNLIRLIDDWTGAISAPAAAAAAAPGGASAAGFAPVQRWWDEAPWKLLREIVDDETHGAKAVHLVAPVFSIIGAPESREAPSFFQINGEWHSGPSTRDSLLDEPNARLRKLYELSVLQRILKDKDDTHYATALARQLENDHRIPPTSRLCGALLKNFGGFASENWRTGDWWWGRIDASAALAERLGRMQPIEHEPGVLSPRAFADSVAEQFLIEETANGTSPEQFGELVTGREGGLDRLDSNYRVSIVHRALRLAVRSFYRVDARMKPLVIGAVHLLVPLLVFLPAAVQWPRIISALALLLGGIVMARAGVVGAQGAVDGGLSTQVDIAMTGGIPSAVALGLVTIATLALMIVGGARTDVRWKVLSDSVTGLVDDAEVAALRARARWRGFACGAAGLFSLGIARLSWWWGDGAGSLLYGLAAIALTVIAAFVVGRGVHVDLPKYARGPSPGFRWIAAISLALAALAPVGSWASRTIASDVLWPVLWITGTLFVISVTLCWGVVGLPRKGSEAAAAHPSQAGDGAETRINATHNEPLARGVEIGGVLLSLVASAAAAAVLWLGAQLGGGELNGWFWVFALLVWSNVLWCVPAWVKLETRAWTDDSIFSKR